MDLQNDIKILKNCFGKEKNVLKRTIEQLLKLPFELAGHNPANRIIKQNLVGV